MILEWEFWRGAGHCGYWRDYLTANDKSDRLLYTNAYTLENFKHFDKPLLSEPSVRMFS
jgi:hypothetical protein